jgi:hypothetical protein
MVATIHTDTFEDSQKLWDLCSMSGLMIVDFIEPNEEEGLYGIIITVETLGDRFAFEKVSRFVFKYFKEKDND